MTEVILEKLKNRDPTLLAESFREINPMLLKLLAANGIFAETAEDLVHQTWERLFTNLDKFEGRSELSTFVCGILFNKIREHRRASGKIIYQDDSEVAMENSFRDDGHWNVPPADPSKLFYSAQISEFIAACLEGLTEQQKSAFVMKEVEGENSPNICNILGISVSNLGVLLFRAKDKLRHCLQGKLGESGEIE